MPAFGFFLALLLLSLLGYYLTSLIWVMQRSWLVLEEVLQVILLS